MPFSATILTLFPEMFPGPLGISLAGKALRDSIWQLNTLNIRDFSTDKHRTVDDTPYGGGAGMVMRADVLDAAISAAHGQTPGAQLIYFTPRGTKMTQPLVRNLSQNNLILLCGRFEGVDQRLLEKHQPLEISLGDFILSGGEIAALALLDVCVRLLPGVIGAEESLGQESFGNDEKYAGLLEYPHYTRPPVWEGLAVPEVLLSGNHAHIEAWRLEQAKNLTRVNRPDLWEKYTAQRSDVK